MRKVAFYTLGCKLNYSETSSIARIFEGEGYKKVAFTDSPDIFIINTCSVTDNADKKCRKIVREANQISPYAFIAVIGCFAQLKPEEISSIPGVDAVLGAAEKFRLIELLNDFQKPEKPKVFVADIKTVTQFEQAYSINDRTRTFLKVQDGCNYNCSFCTIPLARGRSRSDSIENIKNKALEIAAKGVKEVVLTGVNTGDFGIQNGKRVENFLDLIKVLDLVDGIERFRISSIEPNLLTAEIISFVASSQKFVPHFHIPLQSGSDKILKLMYRRYNTDLYREKIMLIRSLLPEACIGVDVIVGFPGETNDDFFQTYQYLVELDISYLHVFTYSERSNTAAVNYEDPVPFKTRNERSKMLRILSEKKRRQFYERNLGKGGTVLFENDVKDSLMFGFTENYIRVSTKYNPQLVNETRKVKLAKIGKYDCVEAAEIDELLIQ